VNPGLFASPREASRWAVGLPEGTPGRPRFDYVPETGSTQDLAFEAAVDGAPHLSVFLAEKQLAGRGRQGSEWRAKPGSSLLLSVLLRPAPGAGRAARISLAAALGTADAIEQTCAIRAGIKWPNDVLIGGGKCGGVIVEVRGGVAVLGVGLNVLQARDEFGPELAETATSLSAELGRVVDRREVLAVLLPGIGAALAAASGDWPAVRARIVEGLAWRGRRVRAGGQVGRLEGIDESGCLLLRAEDGGRVSIASGSPELIES